MSKICSVHDTIPAEVRGLTGMEALCYGKLRLCLRQCGAKLCEAVPDEVCGECQRQEKECYDVLLGIIRGYGPATVQRVYQDALDKASAEVNSEEGLSDEPRS